MHIISHSLATHTKSARQYPFSLNASFYRSFHHMPHLAKIVPYLRPLALLHIFPIVMSGLFAPCLYIGNTRHLIHMVMHSRLPFLGYITAAYGIHHPFIYNLTHVVKRFKLHRIGVEWKKNVGLPHNLSGRHRSEHIKYRLVGQVTFSGCSKRTIKCYTITCCATGASQKSLSRTLRSHRMTTRRTNTYLINLSYRFHIFHLLFSSKIQHFSFNCNIKLNPFCDYYKKFLTAIL